jgi:hypothetical protein
VRKVNRDLRNVNQLMLACIANVNQTDTCGNQMMHENQRANVNQLFLRISNDASK